MKTREEGEHMPAPMNEMLTFGAVDAAATYLNLIEKTKGDVPWWAIGDRRDWTPACIDDAMPLRGAERAVVTAAILASPTNFHLGRWWQESCLAATPGAAIEVLTPSLRRLRPCEPNAGEAAHDAALPVDYEPIVNRLLAGIAISDDEAAHFPFPAGVRGEPTKSTTTPSRQAAAELATMVERLAMAYARMDGGMLSGDALARVLARGLTAAFALSSLGVDPCTAHIDHVVQPTYGMAHIAGFDADRQVASLIGAADVAERIAERILEPAHPFVCDIMTERSRIPAPSRVASDPGALGRDPCTLAQAVGQAQRVARLLCHGSARPS